MNQKNKLEEIYRHLFDAFGSQNWWPGETPFEVCVGAILTQNTNWSNVEKAIINLKKANALNIKALHKMKIERLASLIKPAGYYNIKAGRLKKFADFLVSRHGGSMSKMGKTDVLKLREELLSVKGIGPETADSILLYALAKPVFVIDSYTRRVLSRHGILTGKASYDDYQELFHASLKKDVDFFNEYHALFVRTGKTFCRTKPVCSGCPLEKL